GVEVSWPVGSVAWGSLLKARYVRVPVQAYRRLPRRVIGARKSLVARGHATVTRSDCARRLLQTDSSGVARTRRADFQRRHNCIRSVCLETRRANRYVYGLGIKPCCVGRDDIAVL